MIPPAPSQKDPYQNLISKAKARLEDIMPDIDFDTNPDTARAISEILTTDALLQAGSTISIRWLSPEQQHAAIDGIEDLMFDITLAIPGLQEFYRRIVTTNTIPRRNRLALRPGCFRHPSISHSAAI